MNAFTKINATEDVQILWQCGKYYFNEMSNLQSKGEIPSNVYLSDFISRMDYAYSVIWSFPELVLALSLSSVFWETCYIGSFTQRCRRSSDHEC